MTVSDATLTEITRRLVAAYQPDKVVLFGSSLTASALAQIPSGEGR